ncbi:hypothetical protein A0128_00950 [Leptospira tipperaryensis]|uniref:Phage tail tape measure protein n=1 Tax=Leptospira tipperaryensis TaxID=2564040 RepID=A0A1D7USI4_9LEPT|nr:hypothetical protein [Leptospira tipperaryensis]AOP32567.1 hypothetical protein A0128_00950 [Leptospira tipperaryensis]
MADTDINKLNLVFTIKDLASNKISEINEQWDQMSAKIGENKNNVDKLNSAIEKINVGSQLITLGISLGKFSMELLHSRIQTSKLEGSLRSLGMTSKEVSNISNSAYYLSGKTGIPVDTILTGVKTIKSAFKDLNKSDLNHLTSKIAMASVATKEDFSVIVNALIKSGKNLKNFNGEINGLDFSNLDHLKVYEDSLQSFPTQVQRLSNSWENLKKKFGGGLETSKFGKVFEILSDGIETINELLAANPKLAEFAGTFMMLGSGALIGVGGVLLLNGAILALKTLASAGLITNPFGWIVLGAMAAITVIALIVSQWDNIKAAASNALNVVLVKFDSFVNFLKIGWNKIKSTWSEMPDWARGLIAVIGLIITGPIKPMIVAGILIYKYWSDIKAAALSVYSYVAGLWNNFSNVVSAIWSNILAGFDSAWNTIVNFGDKIVQKFQSIWNAIPLSAKKAGMDLLKALGSGILAGINFVVTPIKNVLARIGRFLPHSNALEGPLSNLTGSGKSFVETFALGIKNGKNTIPVTINQVMTGFENSLGMAKDSGLSFAKTVSSGVLSGITTLKNAGENLYRKGLDVISNHSDAKEGPLVNTSGYGRAFVNTVAHGIESETPKMNPVLQRFNQALTPDSKGIVKRTLENRETSEIVSGNSKSGSNISIGSIVGQLIVGDRKANKKKIGEILIEALFEELDRYEEMELA